MVTASNNEKGNYGDLLHSVGVGPQTLTSRPIMLTIVMSITVTNSLNAHCGSRVGGKPLQNKRYWGLVYLDPFL